MLDNNVYEKIGPFNLMIADLYSKQNKEKALQDFLTSFKSYCFFEKGNVYIFRHDNNGIKYENFIYIGWGDELSIYMKFCDLDDVLPIISSSRLVLFRTSDIFVASDRKKTSYYQNSLKPCKMDYSVEGNLYYEQDGFTCGFGLHRQEKYGDFTDEEMMYVKLARPHLANIVTAICREKSYISGAIERGKEIEMDNAAVWIVNDNFDVETVNIGNNESIEVNRKNIESAVITICRNLSSKISNEEKANSKEFRDQCRITIGDKSYYIDVRYNVSDTDEDTAKYLCMIYDYSNIIDNILIQMKQKYNLSGREFEVLNCLVNGLNNTEISDELCISLPTVKKHTTTIYRKLGIEGRHQLMQIIMWEL